jgi:hypothetical protein
VPISTDCRSAVVTLGARTRCGVIDIMISWSSWVLLREVRILFRMGMLCTPRIPAKVSVSMPCRRPPRRVVSPSWRRSVPVTLRVRNVGTLSGFAPVPTLRSAPMELNSASISSVMSPFGFTRGVISRFTPTFL